MSHGVLIVELWRDDAERSRWHQSLSVTMPKFAILNIAQEH
jgi:hypothetical protein